ncbi:MAG: enoyl-CoA hydratase/isomerase family protein [Acidobacteriaceae bacterium]
MSYKTLLTQEANGIFTITLNRPDRRNALTPQMQEELLQAFDAAERSACGVVVLTGAGAAFCAGLDLEHLQTLASKSSEEHHADAVRIAKMFRTLYDLSRPTIAAVNGAAIAGGTGLATICDFTLAVPEAKFGYTEVRIGFVPALVSAFLALQIGDKQARDLLLTGRIFKADEALALGLVNEMVPAEKLIARTQELAQTLLQNSPASLRATKKLLSAQTRARLDADIETALQANAEARREADFLEGVTSFLEKRPPVWQKPGHK